MHIFIHLLNDFSGSPRVLNQKIRYYMEAASDCLVITNDGNGFIDLSSVPHRLVPYRKDCNRLKWAMRLIFWHIRTFFVVLRTARPGDIVHVNTLLTAVQLLPARIKGARTVIHIHEVRVSSRLYQAFTLWVISKFADYIVYVSFYVKEVLQVNFASVPHCITYPCVDPVIVAASREMAVREKNPSFVVGLVCSMTWYKGYREFVALAQRCPQYHFLLVMNGKTDRFSRDVPITERPANLEVQYNVANVANALVKIDVLLSMTQRTGWIETFGLTLIEGMTFGTPVIAPDIGAPREFVEPGINGYLVDETDLDSIVAIVDQIHSDPQLYRLLSAEARKTAVRFSPAVFRVAVASEKNLILETLTR